MSEKNRHSGFRQTVGHALKAVLPEGTQPPGRAEEFRETFEKLAEEGDDVDLIDWWLPPFLPADLFAAAAYLAKIGGVVPFFEASPYWKADSSCRFGLSADERLALRKAAEEWRSPDLASVVPELVFEIWDKLIEAWRLSITPGTYVSTGSSPAWWKATISLVIIADLACDNLFGTMGFTDDGSQLEPRQTMMQEWIDRLFVEAREESPENFRPPATITMMADSSIVCIMPKVRVAAVGATLRNLSRNLCLLPGRGEVRCYWEAPRQVLPSENSSTLDILLIPEPRSLNATDFVPHDNDGRNEKELRRDKNGWEYFDVEQSWIASSKDRGKFVRDCVSLLRAAKKQSRCVNAIVLPEIALDYELFDHLCAKLKREEPKIEFVVSGASTNCYREHGNHVLTRIWYQGEDRSLTQSRPKHHRWRLDRSQVNTYALGASLNPKIDNWWENTPLGRRELHFQKFRQSSVLSVLICEELARSEPCHEILRAVAPNLIIALLMDGPQLKTRWPAQYAANLADDPGTGVLTFTSFGLIQRSNDQGHYPEARSIALWKDDGGKLVEISMPKGDGMRGILLSLWSEHVSDQTLCGDRRHVRAWRYSGHFPVLVPN